MLIASLLAPTGTPAALLRRWFDGEFEMVVSTLLLAELARALAYLKLSRKISREDAEAFTELLRRAATVEEDPRIVRARSRDPGDDYLLALAASSAAILVTGAQDLLGLKGLPVMSPRAFLAMLPA